MRNNEERLGANPQIQDAVPSLQVAQKNNELNLNFVIPTEFVDLPSKGKFYNSSHPLHGKSSIEIKQMTAKEEDILTSRSLLKKGVALDKLIQSLIVDKNIDPDSLTIEDRNAIIIAARIYGYGEEYVTSVTCPSCDKKAKQVFNLLEKLPNEDQEEVDVEVDNSGNFIIQLPFSKWTFVCRALNGYDEKVFVKLTEAKKKSQNDSMLLEQLELFTVSIQNITARETIREAIKMLPASDSRFLRKTYSQIVKPVDMRHPFKCEHCEYEVDLEVPLTADFFWFK